MSSATKNEEEKYFEVALGLVKRAGKVVRDAYEQPRSEVHTKKSSTDLVTETDQNVEAMLIKGLSSAFPDHKFIGEESASAGKKVEFTDAPTWIIDPVDGTTNFVHRFPMTCISVGLTVKKQLRIGIVYNPITRELYTARAGLGAYKNGFRIHVSEVKEVRNALIGFQVGDQRTEELIDSYIKGYRALLFDNKARGIRSLGSGAINMLCVAEGSLDAFAEYGIHCWDMAAAALIIIEAGGVLIDPTGGEFNLMGRKVLCASTLELATQISGLMTHVSYEPQV